MGRKPTGRPRGRPKGSTGTPAFSGVERARAALLAHAEDYARLHKQAATIAAAKGNSAPSQWALEHLVDKDDKGAEIRPVGAGIDRQAIEGGSKAPTINIGWVLPGAPERPALPPAQHVIDVTSITSSED